ncbi:AsmA-like C-terminal region-containing protein [Dyadobacter sp. CY323]|uniref:AsmA-like C-terminal region-containing protein n=1 Tax=Dyadobacter sp. CY323 TaxID=2907302 RepID=UPI001F334AF5|nr:AsmA-like C-terminal region-containing protein [Dyadobacter sp. CY323]MCE6989031.1 AsmA-like C-terminal region-containing protein [Dyadobacter sp. CY323]
MFARVLKIFGIVALCAFFMFGAVEFWVYKNRDRIFRTVQNAVNENLNGNLEIEDFKFRPFYGGLGLNFTMSNVKLTDSLYHVHKKPFLEADFMHVALDLRGFYKGDIKVKNLVLQNGNLKMFVRRDGYSNLSIFKSTKDSTKKKSGGNNSVLQKLGNIRFINFGVNYADSLKLKYYGAIFRDATNIVSETDSTINSTLTGSVFFNGLTFKLDKGGFLVNQETTLSMAMGFDEDEKKLKIYPSILESATHDKIGIHGEFDFSDTLRTFKLNFEANGIEVKNALPLLTKRLQKQIDSLGIQTSVETRVKVAGQLSGQQPHVAVFFKTDTFNYELPVGVLRNMKADGSFTNQADTTQIPSVFNSRLTAPKVTGFFETIPFTLDLVVNDFRNPRANLDGRIVADSTNLGQLLDPSRYKFKNGTAKIDFHFNGSLKNFYNPDTDQFDGKILGKVSLNDIGMDYLPRKVRLSKIKGDFTFNEKAVVFPDLHFYDGVNMLYLRGKLVDLIPYLFGSPKPLRASVDLNIPSWQLNWLETLLAPRANIARKNKKKLKLSELLDDAIDKMEITAKLDSKKLTYRRFTGKDVKGQFTIKNNAVNIEYFQMKAFGGGNFRISGEMDNSGKSQFPQMALRGKIVNADVHSVFYSFDNFGQKTITHENLNGILSTDFDFQSHLNNNVRLIPSTMRGVLHFNLRNGSISNFEPFMKMKKLIFKRRNFEEVKFAPIHNEVKLKGQEIEIAPMEIESNVLTLYLDGIYSFGRKTDMNIQIPLSNLKKRDSTYVLDPNNREKKEGSKIFLRAIDENGEVNIKLAFRKKKDSKDKEKDKDKAKREEEGLTTEEIQK